MSFSTALSLLNNDYSIRKGRIRLSNGSDSIVDSVYTRLQTEQGEWFLDNRIGVPYYGENGILGRKNNAGVAGIFRREILDVAGVDAINSLSVTRENRQLNVSGSVIINGQSEPVELII